MSMTFTNKRKPPNLDKLSRSTQKVTPVEEFDKNRLIGKQSRWRDLSITGKPHPITGDIVTVVGASAINQSLRNILLADTYERPFTSGKIAGNLQSYLFDMNDPLTATEIKTGISIAIGNHEPRINLLNIEIVQEPTSYSMEVTIVYSIKMTNETHNFSILLERA